MADLSVDFAGIRLENPLVASAGPVTANVEMARKLRDAGVGAIVTKTGFTKKEYERWVGRTAIFPYKPVYKYQSLHKGKLLSLPTLSDVPVSDMARRVEQMKALECPDHRQHHGPDSKGLSREREDPGERGCGRSRTGPVLHDPGVHFPLQVRRPERELLPEALREARQDREGRGFHPGGSQVDGLPLRLSQADRGADPRQAREPSSRLRHAYRSARREPGREPRYPRSADPSHLHLRVAGEPGQAHLLGPGHLQQRPRHPAPRVVRVRRDQQRGGRHHIDGPGRHHSAVPDGHSGQGAQGLDTDQERHRGLPCRPQDPGLGADRRQSESRATSLRSCSALSCGSATRSAARCPPASTRISATGAASAPRSAPRTPFR